MKFKKAKVDGSYFETSERKIRKHFSGMNVVYPALMLKQDDFERRENARIKKASSRSGEVKRFYGEEFNYGEFVAATEWSHLRNRIMPMLLTSTHDMFEEISALFMNEEYGETKDKPPVDVGGKDLLTLSETEIQYVAAAYDLKAVPLYRASSLQESRKALYTEYYEKVLGMEFPKEGVPESMMKISLPDDEVPKQTLPAK